MQASTRPGLLTGGWFLHPTNMYHAVAWNLSRVEVCKKFLGVLVLLFILLFLSCFQHDIKEDLSV